MAAAIIPKGARARQKPIVPFVGHVAEYRMDAETGARFVVLREPMYEADGVTPVMVEDHHFDLVQETDAKGNLVVDEAGCPVWTEERTNERVEMVPAFHEAVFPEDQVELVPEE